MKQFTSETQKIGQKGEEIAVKYLENNGFLVMERNYTKKIGEIDIIARRSGVIHFIEVKSIVKRRSFVSHETNSAHISDVSRETSDMYNPFENFTQNKLRKFSKTIQWFLAERNVSRETRWQIDVIAVILDQEKRSARIEIMWNAIA